jgi:hypothetical protein
MKKASTVENVGLLEWALARPGEAARAGGKGSEQI